ncbi:MAG: CBS domain-containing protein [Candidatus Binatus sp.]
MAVRDVMQRDVTSVQARSTIREFVTSVAAHHRHTVFPVYEGDKVAGTISVSDVSRVAPEAWDKTIVGELADHGAIRVMEDCDLSEALRLLVRERGAQMLLVTDSKGALQGIVTKTDILRAVRVSSGAPKGH